MKKIFACFAALVTSAVLMNISAHAAASDNGVGGVMPALYDGELFKINFKELSEGAAEAIIENNTSLNIIYECDECPGFIAVIDAITAEAGFNPLWLEVQIEFRDGNPPHQFMDDEEILEASANGEIDLIATDEVYRCSVIGKP